MAEKRRHLTLEEAKRRIEGACGVPFRDFGVPIPKDAIVAKGRFGAVLEQYIGLNPFAGNSDFLDGELKTNMTHASGKPKESIFICQIGTLLRGPGGLFGPRPTPFPDSYVYTKVRNMLIVPVVKVNLPPEDWYIAEVYHVVADRYLNPRLFAMLKEDYDSICAQGRKALAEGPAALIHTTNGPNYMQIRTKDGNPGTYKPMYCPHHGRDVSKKRFAFYFRTSLVKDFREGLLPEPSSGGETQERRVGSESHPSVVEPVMRKPDRRVY